jgi:hypothetical protein
MIANVISMFRFDDRIEPSFHLAGLLFPGRNGRNRQIEKHRSLDNKEWSHIFDNSNTNVSMEDMDDRYNINGRLSPYV